MKFLTLPGLCLLLVLCSCTGPEESPECNLPATPLDDELVLDYLFQRGSTWIYENQLGERDTVLLYASTIGATSANPKITCSRQIWYDQDYLSSYEGGFNYYLSFRTIRLMGGGLFGSAGQAVGGIPSSQSVPVPVFETFEVRGETFSNVSHYVAAADPDIQHVVEYDTDYYWAPKIGLVQKVVHDSVNGTQTWDLVAYDLQ